MHTNEQTEDLNVEKPVPPEERDLLVRIQGLPGTEVLGRILDLQDPRSFVRSLTSEDFFWLVKKVGYEDCLPLLELASENQWEYLLDLEIWQGDRLDVEQTAAWLKRLDQADARRLVRWLCSEGEYLANHHLFKRLRVVVVNDQDETWDIPPGFFSLDGVFYFQAVDPDDQEYFVHLLRVLSDEDFAKYQALLLGLSGVIPAELEEEMYRLRNVRLAEHGFLPREEALSVYSPLGIDSIAVQQKSEPGRPPEEEIRSLAPIFPLHNLESRNYLTRTISEIRDPVLMDRVRLEFAGLCNQILSADGQRVEDLDGLIKVCTRAASYLNLALERVCGDNPDCVQEVIKSHSLSSIFRAGFGLALKVKWEAERWVKTSWFFRRGLSARFWGEPWGGVLRGLVGFRPRRYAGIQEGEEYADFEWLSQLGESMDVLKRLMVLDSLMERLTEGHPVDDDRLPLDEVGYLPLLFNSWARFLLGLEYSFYPIPSDRFQEFFHLLRSGEGPPYLMAGWKGPFIDHFMAYARASEPEVRALLEETLSSIWESFCEEYKWVSGEDLDPRFSTHLLVQ